MATKWAYGLGFKYIPMFYLVFVKFNWFMVKHNTNKYIHADIIQAYTLNRQYSFNSLHKPSIGHSYDNLAYDHHIWSLMASTKSHISRWPDNVGRQRKDKSNKYQPRTDIQSIDNNCHARWPHHDVTITNYS